MTEHLTATWGSTAGQKEGGNTTAVMTLERRERGGGCHTRSRTSGRPACPGHGQQRGDILDNIKHEALSTEVKYR